MMNFSKLAIVALICVPSGEAFSPAPLRGEMTSSSLRMDIEGGDLGMNMWVGNKKEQNLLQVQEEIAAAEAKQRQLIESRRQLEMEMKEAEEARTRLMSEVVELESTADYTAVTLAAGLVTPLAAVAGARSYLSNRSSVQKQQAEMAAAKAAAVAAALIDTKKKKSGVFPNPFAAIKGGAMDINQQMKMFSSKTMDMNIAKSFSMPDMSNLSIKNGKAVLSGMKSKPGNEKRDQQLMGAVATAATAAWILGSSANPVAFMGQNTNTDKSNTNKQRTKTPTELIAKTTSDIVEKASSKKKLAPIPAASIQVTPPAASTTVTLANTPPKFDPPKAEVQLEEQKETLASIMAMLDAPETKAESVVTTTAPVVVAEFENNLNFGSTFTPNDDFKSSLVANVDTIDEMYKAPVIEFTAPIVDALAPTVVAPIEAIELENTAPLVAAIVEAPTIVAPVEAEVAPIAQVAPVVVASEESLAPVIADVPSETVFPFATAATPPMKQVTTDAPSAESMWSKLDTIGNEAEKETIFPFASVATPPFKMPSNDEVAKTSATIFSSIHAPDLVASAKDVRSNFLKTFSNPAPQAAVVEKKVTLHPSKPKVTNNTPLSNYAIPLGGAAAVSFAAVAIAAGVVEEEDEYEEYMSSEYEDYNQYMKAHQVGPPMVPATVNGAGLRSYNSIPTNVARASNAPNRANDVYVTNAISTADGQVMHQKPELISSGGMASSYLESFPAESSKTPTGQGNISYLDRL